MMKERFAKLLHPKLQAFSPFPEIPGTPSTLATTFLAFVLNLAFALSVFGFLVMHVSLVAANTTTIEFEISLSREAKHVVASGVYKLGLIDHTF
ncbi:hypothetical protein K1719_000160 [Acacia pycnantha]|nr:hypothetical protein K1719_000160 [Acacia pycnantha]